MLKRLFAGMLLLSALHAQKAISQEFINDKIDILEGTKEYLLNCVTYKPAGFSTATKYPLVLYFHGIGEAGTDVNKMYTSGLPKVLKDGYKPSFNFIMIAPQHNSYAVDPKHVEEILNESIRRYPNIDLTRIYIVGVSSGGNAVYGSSLNISTALSKRFAAMVVHSGATQLANKSNIAWWKDFKTPLWSVVGNNDVNYRDQNVFMVNEVNKQVPGLAAITIRDGIGHGNWNDVFSGIVKTTNGQTMWQWIYSFTRAAGADPIQTDAVTAGTGQRVLIDIGATATGTDQWGKVWNNLVDARPGVRISNAKTTTNTATTISLEVLTRIDGTFSTTGKGINAGNTIGIVSEYPASATADYAFGHKSTTAGKWKVAGLTSSKTYTIKFWGTKSSTYNYTIQIKRSDETAWQEYNASNNKDFNRAAVFTISGKTEMTFDIRAKTGSDFGYISVLDISEGTSGGTGNQTPSANAGTDKTLTLPANSANLSGTGSDADGSIASYNWTKTAGPSQYTINNPNIAAPIITNMVAGTYTFQLKVTDNLGATATDNLNIVVKSASTSTTSHTLQFDSKGDAYFPNGTGLGWKPGDTVYIPAGNYNLIDLGNIKGTAAQPIVIRNKGGLVTLQQIRLNNKIEYFKILGNGAPGITYGIKINNTKEQIAFAASMVSDMEVGYIEVSKGATGIVVKKNPVAGDPSTQYPNYVIRNIKIHHTYVHDIVGEGMYIGSTVPSGTADGIPIRLENVQIYNNTVERTGWDGIQMSTTVGVNSIHDNIVRNFGTANFSSQQSGIGLGGAATGDIYNNTISNGTGWGINAMGYGVIRIYNNTVENVGANGIDKGNESIYADDRVTGPETFPKQQMIITNNIIKNPQPDGAIRVGAYNGNSLPSTITGNTVYLVNAASNWLTFYVVSNALLSIISGNTVVR
jgi:hypothetical protein